MTGGRGRAGTGARCIAAAVLLAVAGVRLVADGAADVPGATARVGLVRFAPSRTDALVSALPERAPALPEQAPTRPATLPQSPPEPVPAVVAPVAVASGPIEPPEDERGDEPEVVLGTIEIPRLGLSVPLHEGISLDTIDRGPSHWPGSALPGEVGNVVVAGHRVTRTRPFRDIDRLQPGDEVVLTAGGVRASYAVNGHEVVTPDAMRIVDPTPTATATLFACHPPGSARQRYVVTADLVRTEPAPPQS